MAKGVKGSGVTEDIPTRTSMIIKPSRTRKLKYIALKDNITLTSIVDNLISGFIETWEKKNGEIKI